MKITWIVAGLFVSILPCVYGQALHEEDFIFDPAVRSRGHVHASSIVECPNGSLLVAWYENGPRLPSYEYVQEADKSDDVRIAGARRQRNQTTWDESFVMSDTFGVSDNNPAMAIDQKDRLWLVHATLLAVPERTWGSSLLWYKVASDFQGPGPPRWDRESVLIVRPRNLEESVLRSAKRSAVNDLRERLKDPFARRLGWMPRAHLLALPQGAVLIPLANENFNVAAMALSSDGGETWTFSNPVPGSDVSQPSVVRLASGKLVAFFRDEGTDRRIKRSESLDGGLNWSEVVATRLANPGSGVEAVVLEDGHLLIVYNDSENTRDRLAVSISTDDGASWKWTRHLESRRGGRFDYPSIIQARDGTLHITYSYNVQTIKHVHFNEEWIRQGD